MITSDSDFQLFDEKTFYPAFLKDLESARKEVIIESPFITNARVDYFIPHFNKLLKRGINIIVMTRCFDDLEGTLKIQAEYEITRFEYMGIQPLLCEGNLHRKLAFLDRKVLWEGSLNILSQSNSRELMKKVTSRNLVEKTFKFLNYNKFIFEL